nr:hypothetical protein [Tanacetum cinerariifolium]
MMASLFEDINSVGFDTRPPMLDWSDFESWKQHIRLYCKGKENEENILQSIDEVQGLPKDIYTLINHYTNAKYIWDNVKMLLEGSELTRNERESQLYDDFEHFYQNKREIIHEYYARMFRVDRTEFRGTMQREQLQLEIKEFRTELVMQILVKQSLLSVITEMRRVILDEKQLLFIAGGQDNTFDDDVDEPSTMFMANLSSIDPIYDEAGIRS